MGAKNAAKMGRKFEMARSQCRLTPHVDWPQEISFSAYLFLGARLNADDPPVHFSSFCPL